MGHTTPWALEYMVQREAQSDFEGQESVPVHNSKSPSLSRSTTSLVVTRHDDYIFLTIIFTNTPTKILRLFRIWNKRLMLTKNNCYSLMLPLIKCCQMNANSLFYEWPFCLCEWGLYILIFGNKTLNNLFYILFRKFAEEHFLKIGK